MDNLKLYIIESNKNIKDLQTKRKAEYKELALEEDKLNNLIIEEDNLNTNKQDINEIIKLANNKKIFILKDELVVLIAIILSALIAIIPTPAFIINLTIMGIFTSLLFNLQVLSNYKNKKLIDYYKKTNNINPRKNVNIGIRKIKALIPKVIASKEATDLNLENNKKEIQQSKENIYTHQSSINKINNKLKNYKSTISSLVNKRSRIIDEIIETQPTLESQINRSYTRTLKKTN